jgi:hypothetical protein
MRPLNNKGSILIVSLMVLYILASQSVSFSLFDVSELNESRRYCRSVSAFWLAEAGINMYMHDPTLLNQGAKTIDFGGGSIHLSRDDSKPLVRLINAIGIYQGTQKAIQISYTANVPEAYKNAVSTKGDITINGAKVSVIANDKVRLSGKFMSTSHNSVFFEDKQEGVDPTLTSVADPSILPSDNDQAQLRAFIKSFGELVSSYPSDQVLYLKGQDTYTINADTPLAGKKIVYVEGNNDKDGNVVIEVNGVAADQNLTIIATGTVTFHQSGYQAPNSTLNIIAWRGYEESVSAPSMNRGIIYTHGVARFDQITENSTTSGSVIADGGLEFGEIWSTKVFNYADMTRTGVYPPGFEKLTGGSLDTNAAQKPNLWRQVAVSQ